MFNKSRYLKRKLKRTLLHPRYLSNRAIRKALQLLAPRVTGALLDTGCGYKPYQSIFSPYVTKYVGVDVPSTIHGMEASDVAGTALQLPLKAETFDTVLATEVMEHVPEPSLMLAEIYRVLRPNGALILSVPFHEPLHELPYDFYRYTYISLRYLFEKNGFRIETYYRRGGIVLVLCHLLCSYLYRRFGVVGYPQVTHSRPIMAPIIIFVCMVLQSIAAVLDPIVNDDFDTLGFVVFARKV